ncbi:MAG: OmpA family protein [Bdellovibrionales bacterium]|nr:OmpA family protein [Bdellovibrionales bacterium]
MDQSNDGSQKSPDSFEWLLGLKHDIGNNAAVHFGGGTQLFSALGSPEMRLYAGLNWSFGPFCEDTLQPVAASTPVAPKQARKDKLRYNASVLFDVNSADLRSGDLPEVNEYFDNLEISKLVSLTVEGHTDSRGDADYNQALSERRAVTLKQYLLKRYPTLRSEIVHTVGHGEEKPVADNANYQGRQQNRRVEFIIEVMD